MHRAVPSLSGDGLCMGRRAWAGAAASGRRYTVSRRSAGSLCPPFCCTAGCTLAGVYTGDWRQDRPPSGERYSITPLCLSTPVEPRYLLQGQCRGRGTAITPVAGDSDARPCSRSRRARTGQRCCRRPAVYSIGPLCRLVVRVRPLYNRLTQCNRLYSSSESDRCKTGLYAVQDALEIRAEERTQQAPLETRSFKMCCRRLLAAGSVTHAGV
jgi:hypothetical protein